MHHLLGDPAKARLFGVLHLPPLPGAPRYDGRGLDSVLERAMRDADVLLGAGFDGFVVENFGDAPFFPDRVGPETVAAMTVVVAAVAKLGGVVGVNILRNDARAALAVAAATGAHFIRVNVHVGAVVTDQGLVQGRAAETLRYRRALGAEVAIAADVDVKHGTPLGGLASIAETAEEAVGRGLADAIIVTGRATGRAVDLRELEAVKGAVPDRPVLTGSGADASSIGALLAVADGVIVGTAIKEGGRVTAAVDADLAAAFVRAARSG